MILPNPASFDMLKMLNISENNPIFFWSSCELQNWGLLWNCDRLAMFMNSELKKVFIISKIRSIR